MKNNNKHSAAYKAELEHYNLLKKQLAQAELKVELLNSMIDIAEEEFDIKIRPEAKTDE